MGLEFGELFKKSWSEYRKNLKTILMAYWWFVILFAIITNVLLFSFFSNELLGSYASNTPSLTGNSILTGMAVSDASSLGSASYVFSWNYWVFIIITSIISSILSFFLYLSLVYLSLYGPNGMSFRRAVSGGKSFFWKVLGLSIIIILVAFACLLPFFIVLGIGLVSLLVSPILAVLVILLSVALLFGGLVFLIYLGISWIFSVYVLMRENTGIIESLRRSKRIVKGKWWTVFGYYLLLALIFVGISIVFGIPKLISLVFMIIAGVNITSLVFSTLVNFIFSMAASIIITPLMIIFLKNLYLALRAGKGRK